MQLYLCKGMWKCICFPSLARDHYRCEAWIRAVKLAWLSNTHGRMRAIDPVENMQETLHVRYRHAFLQSLSFHDNSLTAGSTFFSPRHQDFMLALSNVSNRVRQAWSLRRFKRAVKRLAKWRLQGALLFLSVLFKSVCCSLLIEYGGCRAFNLPLNLWWNASLAQQSHSAVGCNVASTKMFILILQWSNESRVWMSWNTSSPKSNFWHSC